MARAGAVLAEATRRLKEAGIEAPRLDALLLLSHATGFSTDRLRVDPDLELPPAGAAHFASLLARRLDREPVSHILGHREFWSLDFRVSRDVLDPRPDSETLVAAVLEQIADRRAALRVADFGTGSGCLLLALLHELPQATGLGIDKSPAALAVARENAAALGLAARATLREGDWGGGLEGYFDILISNPPYIESGTVPDLAPEVARHEPVLALDGGADGLDAYRRLIPDLARLAAKDALVAMEIGQGQEKAVTGMFAAAGLQAMGGKADLAGITRVVLARKPR
jgi:release factor glutamine methyltransferase